MFNKYSNICQWLFSQPTWSPLCLTTQMVRYDHPTPRICAMVIQIFWTSKLHNSQPNDVNTNLMQAWHRRHSTCGASELCFYTKFLVVINMMNHYFRENQKLSVGCSVVRWSKVNFTQRFRNLNRHILYGLGWFTQNFNSYNPEMRKCKWVR